MSIKELRKLTTKIVYIGALMLTSCGESGEFVYNNLSGNKILFTTRTVENWTGQQAKSRAVLESNERGPLIVKTNMSTPLYLHPVTQIGTHIQTANNIPITKSGRVIVDESTGKVIPTRGTPNTSSSIGSSFGLLAYRSASSATDLNGIAPDFINNQQVTTSGSLWKTNTDYFWPDDGDKLSFFAYTPFGDNNVTVSSASSTGTPSITYTANTDVTKQPDLMVAKTVNQTRNSTSIAAGVDMSFYHALTAITFAVGKDMVPGVFTSVSIKNAITTATYNLLTNSWNTSNGTSIGNISLNLNGTTGITIDGTADVALTSGTTTMMMIPQAFASGSNAVIEVVFNNGNGDKTLTAPLAGTAWAAGTSIIYKLSTSSINTMTLGTISYPSSWGGAITPTTSFSSGNDIGLFVVDQNNNIKNSNVKVTYNGSNWVLPSTLLFSPQYKYFAYYPYQSGYSSSSVSPSATNADGFFSGVISGWTVSSDQNTTDKFNQNDLQVSMGTISSTASSITFDMAHKMGLAVITLGTKSVPTTRTYIGGNSTYSDSSDKTTVTASSNFSGNQPVSYNNKYYYITKAGTSTTFNSITADNDTWSAPLSTTISSGNYSALTATNTSRTFYKFIANFNYTGAVQSFTIPLYGTSKFECWGASGGSATYGTTVLGGKGGYSYENITSTKDKVLYISIGGAGANGTTMNTTLGGWNGGASRVGTNPDHIVGGGGGCTSIQSTLIEDGQLKKYESVKNTDVLIVAGGGGGGFWHTVTNFSGIGGTGGGTNGGNGTSGFTETPQPWGSGGTQTSGGTNSYNEPGYFGMGGGDQNLHAGGGGGWYGGGAGYGGAGGGSGYIGGITNGGTSNGVRNGNGFACITFVP
ncbi:fimbrillin family protein [Prevotella sp.]|uniref:fimbrillin family protein n=1 Tax=Prevotella sp. TaxID=59823 RepID=UPI00264913BB|nr:fimbrillin family protein [Prevotella sp.]MDN5554397.1 fimbrillin family protein [Prevotella sp.]